jgi:hypothetical protein
MEDTAGARPETFSELLDLLCRSYYGPRLSRPIRAIRRS